MDSVQSRPMFSNRALVSLSVPIVIDAILAIFTGMVDSAMVSSAGEAAVGAISLVDQLFLLLVNLEQFKSLNPLIHLKLKLLKVKFQVRI